MDFIQLIVTLGILGMSWAVPMLQSDDNGPGIGGVLPPLPPIDPPTQPPQPPMPPVDPPTLPPDPQTFPPDPQTFPPNPPTQPPNPPTQPPNPPPQPTNPPTQPPNPPTQPPNPPTQPPNPPSSNCDPQCGQGIYHATGKCIQGSCHCIYGWTGPNSEYIPNTKNKIKALHCNKACNYNQMYRNNACAT